MSDDLLGNDVNVTSCVPARVLHEMPGPVVPPKPPNGVLVVGVTLDAEVSYETFLYSPPYAKGGGPAATSGAGSRDSGKQATKAR